MWRYFATRLNGDGTETFLAGDLPISDGEFTTELSGHNTLSGVIRPEIQRLKAPGGGPLLQPWSSAVYAEENGVIIGGGILVEPVSQGSELVLDCIGLTGYADGMPYVGEWSRVEVDALDAFREGWRHLQAQQGGNLGLAIPSSVKSGVLLGKRGVSSYTEAKIGETWVRVSSLPAGTVKADAKSTLAAAMTASQTTLTLTSVDKFADRDLPFTVTVGSETIKVAAFNPATKVASGLTRGTNAATHSKGSTVTSKGTQTRQVAAVSPEPFVLSDWNGTDVGETNSRLAQETPFEWVEQTSWSGDTLYHSLALGSPRLGRRRQDRYVIGENVIEEPDVSTSDYASEVLVLGAGEGRAMVRGRAFSPLKRLRRVHVHQNSAVGKKTSADTLASRLIPRMTGAPEVTSLTIVGDAPTVGDEIRVLGSGTGWSADLDVWVRVQSTTRKQGQDITVLDVRSAE